MKKFLDGMSRGDSELISSMVTPPLFRKLEPALKLIDEGKMKFELESLAPEESQLKNTTAVFPYVVLGASMREFNEEGLKTFRLGRARFVRRKGEDESWKDWLSCLEKRMVFGFECHWETGRLGRLVSEEHREQGEI